MKSLKGIAFLQAAGVSAYIALFAIMVQSVQAIHPPEISPILGIGVFLLTFVTSALICGSIVFGYPVVLFLDGKRREALEIVGWTMAWCVIILAIAGGAVLLIG